MGTKVLCGPQSYPSPAQEPGRGQGRAKMVFFHWFRSAWRNRAEQQLSVNICSHFPLQMLCDDASSKIKDTASQAIKSTRYSYMISYFVSLLQPVQKHLACPTVSSSTSSYLNHMDSLKPVLLLSHLTFQLGWNESRQAEIVWLITQIWGMSALEWQTKCLTLMTVIYSPHSHQPCEQE